MKLSFGKANTKLVKLEKKLGKKLYTFSLLSGFNCPGAKECQSFAVKTDDGMRIRDGKHTEFRCFSASQEVLLPSVYKSRSRNQELVKLAAVSVQEAADKVVSQLPKNAGVVRIHVAGDFVTLNYFDMWLEVARRMPHITFYAYTKSIHFWVKRIDSIPSNLILTASIGGRFDHLIKEHNLKSVQVVYSQYQARKLKLPIDKDDSHALQSRSFALLIHASQPKGSKAAKAWERVKNTVGGYGDAGYFK